MKGLELTGIKCDVCDYAQDTGCWGSTAEEILRANDFYLNKLCPKCGANLLTPADHKTIIRLVRVMRVFGKISEWLSKLPFKCCQKQAYDIQMNGTGRMEFEKPDTFKRKGRQ